MTEDQTARLAKDCAKLERDLAREKESRRKLQDVVETLRMGKLVEELDRIKSRATRLEGQVRELKAANEELDAANREMRYRLDPF